MNERRLLVLRLSALGDVIHTIPAVTALRASLPTTKISWAVEAPYRDLVQLVAEVEAIPIRLKKWARAPISSRAAIASALRAMRGSDIAVDFQGLVKSAMLGRLAGANERYGFDRHAIRERAALLFTNHRVSVDTSAHVVDQNIEFAKRIVTELDVPRIDWSALPADPEGKLAAFIGSVVLLPSAGKANKVWPAERFRELAATIGPRALAVWGPGERDRAEALGCRVAPPTTLRELAWLLAHAEVVVGGDTGPLHLAAALGTRVVGLYGPTDPRRTGPYGQLDRCVDHFQTTKLMDSISVEEVMNTLQRVTAE